MDDTGPDPVRGTSGFRDAHGYADLRHYAAIGDGRTVALIAGDGRVDWLPIPALDSVPVFWALLDAVHGGYIALVPVEPHTVTQRYEPGANVLITSSAPRRAPSGSRIRSTPASPVGCPGRSSRGASTGWRARCASRRSSPPGRG